MAAIIASKSSLYRKLLLPEAVFQFFMTYLFDHPARFNIFSNYCENFATTFCSYIYGITDFLMI